MAIEKLGNISLDARNKISELGESIRAGSLYLNDKQLNELRNLDLTGDDINVLHDLVRQIARQYMQDPKLLKPGNVAQVYQLVQTFAGELTASGAPKEVLEKLQLHLAVLEGILLIEMGKEKLNNDIKFLEYSARQDPQSVDLELAKNIGTASDALRTFEPAMPKLIKEFRSKGKWTPK
jgi:hypothetical protein